MKKLYFTSFLLGALSSLSFTFFIFILFKIVGYYFLLRNLYIQKSLKKTFFLGMFFGFGHFLIGLHWIIFPLTFEESHKVLIPFVIFLFPFLLSFFFSLPYFFSKILTLKFISKREYFFLTTFIIALILFSGEILRSFLFGGFPWNLNAHIWVFNEKFIQISEIFGVYGLSFLTFFWLVLFANLVLKKRKEFALIVLILLPSGLYLYSNISNKNTLNEKIRIRIIQPNIPQDIKWSKDHFDSNIRKMINLSIHDTNLKIPDLLIWPEAAIPLYLNKNSEFKKKLISLLPFNFFFITGSLRLDLENKIFNSMYVLSKASNDQYYDKRKLVPFGEFMPLRSMIPFKKITQGSKDFSQGKEQKVFKLKVNEKIFYFEPSICYEGIFQNKVDKKLYSNLIINITNDAWFGKTTGPKQHLSANIFRSVENGIPLIRVSNSGISGVYDADGKMIKVIRLNKVGYSDVEIKMGSGNTIFSSYGNKVLIFLIFLICLLSLIADTLFFQKNKKDQL